MTRFTPKVKIKLELTEHEAEALLTLLDSGVPALNELWPGKLDTKALNRIKARLGASMLQKGQAKKGMFR